MCSLTRRYQSLSAETPARLVRRYLATSMNYSEWATSDSMRSYGAILIRSFGAARYFLKVVGSLRTTLG